ncbi:MAG TPA: alpha/beta hydrolase, partial [Bacteroidales bacterium]|nr:alpha/beta hydrolase [Bacteroidales bacterium]
FLWKHVNSPSMVKKIIIVSITIIIAAIAIIAARNLKSTDNPCKNEKYITAEPGTCLDPGAYRLIQAVEKFEENPYKNDFAIKLVNLFEPRIYKTIDTVATGEEFDVPLRIYYPNRKSVNSPTPVIMFIHGGGFVFGSIEEYDMAVKKFAKVTGYIIVSINYRLAPEHPFPAALNDAEQALSWITSNMEFIGGKGKKICVMGDSAGANLATVIALKNRNEDKNQVLCQILYYPPTTFEEKVFPSRRYFLLDTTRTYLLSEEFVRKSKESYIPPEISVSNPYVSPLKANLEKKLPPVLIMNAQIDPLRDDGRLYAEKLEKAGQNVTYIEYPGILHGFFNFYMIFDEGVESMKKAKDFITGNLNQEGEDQG